MSVGIAKLEQVLGLQLFVRSNQRVELTDAGARFVAHAKRIEHEFNAALQAMGSSQPHRTTLRLGVLSSIAGESIAAAIDQEGPLDDYRLELIFGSERELVNHLANGRIDLALTLVGRGSDRFLESPVLTEGYALALSAKHRLASEKEIAPEQLTSEVMIVRRHCEALSETSRFFTERGIRPHFALRSTNDERVIQMVAAGLGLTIMPCCYESPKIVRPLLTGFSIKRTIGWAAAHDAEHLINDKPGIVIAIESQLNGAARRSAS